MFSIFINFLFFIYLNESLFRRFFPEFILRPSNFINFIIDKISIYAGIIGGILASIIDFKKFINKIINFINEIDIFLKKIFNKIYDIIYDIFIVDIKNLLISISMSINIPINFFKSFFNYYGIKYSSEDLSVLFIYLSVLIISFYMYSQIHFNKQINLFNEQIKSSCSIKLKS